jgi:hypothetical protein
MAPQILHRVIHGSSDPEPWQKALLSVKPALLPGYRRHRVARADYPAIIATEAHAAEKAASVLGTLVTGLTEGDLYRLDMFEGGEYEKRVVKVRVLAQSSKDGDEDLQHVLNEKAHSSEDTVFGEKAMDVQIVEALTYVWIAGKKLLEDAEWDFESFQREKMQWWLEADPSEL